MNAVTNPQNGPAVFSGTQRVVSIDIFRGLTMIVMIFVNDLSSVNGLPWWTYHMPARIDAMTYVDMVFPFFLFTVGMSMPVAVRLRLKRDPRQVSLWLHVIKRSFSLIVLGLILANAEKGDPTRMGMNNACWAVLALAGAVLLWLMYPDSPRYAALFRGLRILGAVMIVAMFAVFRRTIANGQAAWIDFSYPEILGLIGFTYISVSVLYIPTRRWLWTPLAWLVALVALCALSTAHWIQFPSRIPLYEWPFGNGAMPAITMAGIITSIIFLGEDRWRMPRHKMLLAATFAAMLVLAGKLMTPLGISKIRATPTWCLYSAGTAVLVFALLYWVCDVKAQVVWARFARPAGANTLLTYLLPDFFYYLTALAGFTYLESHFNSGAPGVVRAILFTATMVVISALLTRLRIRMQL